MNAIKNYFKFKKTSKVSLLSDNILDKNVKVKKTKSIKLTIFLMRVLGLWRTSGKIEKVMSNILLASIMMMLIFDIFSQFKDLYYSRRNFTKVCFVAPVACLVTTESVKVIIFIFNRNKVMKMNLFIDENIWKKNYNKEDTITFNYCERVCRRVITFYVVLGQCVVWHYLLLPVFDGNTSGRRELPFAMPFESPISFETPFYELFYVIQILGTMSVFLCTVTFASYLFSISLFTASQFKMLSKSLTLLCDFGHSSDYSQRLNYQLEALNRLKQCIRLHQMLISLIKEIEDLYCYILLGQMVGSVMEICFCGLQILLVTTTLQRQILSFNLLLSCSIQLYLFCYSSHEVYLASENVARAAYSMKWFRITNPRIHRDFALLVQIIAHRARRPCILSVGKFYPLTLETFASVLRTSLSYFTVLRKIIH